MIVKTLLMFKFMTYSRQTVNRGSAFVMDRLAFWNAASGYSSRGAPQLAPELLTRTFKAVRSLNQ